MCYLVPYDNNKIIYEKIYVIYFVLHIKMVEEMTKTNY